MSAFKVTLASILGVAGAILGGIGGTYVGTAVQRWIGISGILYLPFLILGALLGAAIGVALSGYQFPEAKDEALATRTEAVSLGETPALEDLLDALRSEDQQTRARAVSALAASMDPGAVEPLLSALDDPKWNVRWTAAEVLGKLGDVRAVQPLTRALGDANALVRDAAQTALASLGEQHETNA